MTHKLEYPKKIFLTSLPEGFLNPTQSEKFLRSTFAENQIKILTDESGLGVACDFYFVTVEYFTGDGEPQKSKERGLGMQVWHRLKMKEQPRGWLSLPRFLRRSTVAVVDVRTLSQKYWNEWSVYGKRYRKKWYSQKDLIIREIEKESFVEAYAQSTLRESLKPLFRGSIDRYQKYYREDAHFYGAVERATGKVIAGLMIVDDFVTKQTIHPVAFILPEAKKTQAALALMDYWFRESIQKKMSFMNLGIVWMPGDPPSWKGYSRFKMHFNPQLLVFEKPLIRFFWNRSHK